MANLGTVTKAASSASKTAANTTVKVANTASTAAKNTAQSTISTAKSTLEEYRDKYDRIKSLSSDEYDSLNGTDVSETELEEGQRVAPGKVVKNGEIQDSATRQTLKAAVNIAGIATGGTANAGKEVLAKGGEAVVKETAKGAAKEATKEAAKEAAKGAAKNVAVKGANAAKKGPLSAVGKVISKSDLASKVINFGSKFIDRGVGHIADTLDLVPGFKKLNKYYLGDAAQAINSAFDIIGDLLNLDLAAALKNLGRTIKGLFKFTGKTILLLIAIIAIISLGAYLIVMLPVLTVLIPVLFATDIISGRVSNMDTTYVSSAYPAIDGAEENMSEAVKAVLGEVPDYDILSQGRKAVIIAGATAIGKPYKTNGKPVSTTIGGISDGVDGGGLIEWVFWNITGSDPGTITSQSIASDSKFVLVLQSNIKPGDIGVSATDLGIYLGNNNWIHVDKASGVIRSSYSGFSSYYSYKDIDTIAIASSGVYYDGEGPSGGFRDRVLFYANKLMEMRVPYNNIGQPYNGGYSLDINAQGFGTVVPGKTIDYENENKNVLDGLDCCGYAGYVYYLAANGKNNAQWMCSYTMGSAGYRDIPNFKQIKPEDAQPGDLIVKFNGHVALFDYWGNDGSLHVYNSNRNDKTHTTYEVNGRTIKYNGTIIKQTYTTKDVYFFTYVGDEGNE